MLDNLVAEQDAEISSLNNGIMNTLRVATNDTAANTSISVYHTLCTSHDYEFNRQCIWRACLPCARQHRKSFTTRQRQATDKCWRWAAPRRGVDSECETVCIVVANTAMKGISAHGVHRGLWVPFFHCTKSRQKRAGPLQC